MSIRKYHSNSIFEDKYGYSRAVRAGDWVFISGTTGYDYEKMKISDKIENQLIQCLKNIDQALGALDATVEQVVKVTYILADAEDFGRCQKILKNKFHDIRPAATMIASNLINTDIKIEIELTAYSPSPQNTNL